MSARPSVWVRSHLFRRVTWRENGGLLARAEDERTRSIRLRRRGIGQTLTAEPKPPSSYCPSGDPGNSHRQWSTYPSPISAREIRSRIHVNKLIHVKQLPFAVL